MSQAHSSSSVRSYTFAEVVRVSGATKSNVTHWAREGLIRPALEQTTGTGHHRRFGFGNLVEARLAKHLNAGGMPIAHMSVLLDHVRFIDEASRAVAAGDTLQLRRILKQLLRNPSRRAMGATLEQLQALGRQWQVLKTRELRTIVFKYFGVAYSLIDGTSMLVIIEKEDEFSLTDVGEAAVLVDMFAVLGAVELATDDQWPGGVTPATDAEVAEWEKKNGGAE
jgi:DNA-binding transcriptional MerR regulator